MKVKAVLLKEFKFAFAKEKFILKDFCSKRMLEENGQHQSVCSSIQQSYPTKTFLSTGTPGFQIEEIRSYEAREGDTAMPVSGKFKRHSD